MTYSPHRADLYRRGAVFVDKILRGARPADLPVERATRFEMVINMKTAKALGLTIPPLILGRADQVTDQPTEVCQQPHRRRCPGRFFRGSLESR
jgi:putative tryptophan/tyrosine transport system substrate-binding protein